MKKIYNITILWGTQGFGKWLAEYIQTHFSDSVDITITGSSDDNVAAVKWADIIIYCVPISCMQKVIEETISHLSPGSIVCDVTSIKKFPSQAMQQRDDIIVIPTHPMFGPYISSIAGQVIVLTPEEKHKDTPAYRFLKAFLASKNAKVHECDPGHHDKMMAIVQWLTHLNMFVIGETMKRLGVSVEESMHFVSPIYKLMISSVGRYLGQNPRLYADIQMYNDEIIAVHEKFLDTAKNFHQSVLTKNTEKFCHDILAARDFFGTDMCQEGQEYTDMIIDMLGKEQE